MGLSKSLLVGLIGSLLCLGTLGAGISIQLGKRSVDRVVDNKLETGTGDVPLLNYLDAQVRANACLTNMHARAQMGLSLHQMPLNSQFRILSPRV